MKNRYGPDKFSLSLDKGPWNPFEFPIICDVILPLQKIHIFVLFLQALYCLNKLGM